MADVYDQVQAALETSLATYSGAPKDGATGRLLIAFENDRFEPADDHEWWRAQFVPVAFEPGSLGENGYTRIDGEFVIDLFYPAGGGSGKARRAADALSQHFRRAQSLESDGVKVWIRGAPREPGITEDRWHSVQVRVRWTCHRTEL